MIEPFKIAKFLDNLEITIEEYWLCYRIMLIRNNFNDTDITVPNGDMLTFSQLSKKYQERFKTQIDFKKMTLNLEDKGFIDIWSHDLNNFDIKHITINEKFLQYFYIDDLRACFAEFVQLYPKVVHIEDKKLYSKKVYSVYGKNSEDELIDLMQKYILKGNSKILFVRFMEITKMYLDDQNTNSATMNIESYFKSFEGIAKIYEDSVGTREKSLFTDDL